MPCFFFPDIYYHEVMGLLEHWASSAGAEATEKAAVSDKLQKFPKDQHFDRAE